MNLFRGRRLFWLFFTPREKSSFLGLMSQSFSFSTAHRGVSVASDQKTYKSEKERSSRRAWFSPTDQTNRLTEARKGDETRRFILGLLANYLSQISARLDCVENLIRQRHDRDQTENQQNATVDSCFELVGYRQHGVAQQKVEHQRESSGLPNARGSRFRMGPNSDVRPRHSA